MGSRLLGEFVRRLGQPAIVGEILAGIILGPAVLNYVQPTDHLAGIADLSVFLIVLSAGLEMELKDVLSALTGRGFVATVADFVVPLMAGLAMGIFFRFDAMHSIFLGLCLSITALPVAVRILEKFKLLNTRIARYSIAVAILNDVVALLCLGVILDMSGKVAGASSFSALVISILRTSGKLLLLALLIFLVSRLLVWGGTRTHYIERFLDKVMALFGKEALFGVAILFVLFFSSMSEALGSHFVIGTFFAGLLLSEDVFGSSLFADVEHTLHSITDGFLAPIFFAYLGLHFTLGTFTSPFFVALLVLLAIASKVGAGWFGARWIKMSPAEALGVGIMLNGRGIMELVVANIALQRGFIDQGTFSALVFMGIFTTVITPILFKRFVVPKLGMSTA